MAGDRRKLTSLWVTRRRGCRHTVQAYMYMLFVMLLTAPFVVFGDTQGTAAPAHPAPAAGVFGLDPDLVKLAFLGLFSFVVWLFKKAIDNNTRLQNALFRNDREIVEVLIKLLAMHNMNHGQEIQPPRFISEQEAQTKE